MEGQSPAGIPRPGEPDDGPHRPAAHSVTDAADGRQERESLDDILAAWCAETPVPEDIRQQAEAELDQAGLTD